MVYLFERFKYLVFIDVHPVREHAYVGSWVVMIPERDGIVDNPAKLGMQGGLSVPRERDHVEQDPFFPEQFQFFFQRQTDVFAVREFRACPEILVEPALAVDAVERAKLSVVR